MLSMHHNWSRGYYVGGGNLDGVCESGRFLQCRELMENIRRKSSLGCIHDSTHSTTEQDVP